MMWPAIPDVLRRIRDQRLFWKILFGFWLTFLLIVEGVWIYLALLGDKHRPADSFYMERSVPLHLTTLQWALKTQGIDGVTAVLKAWPENDRAMISVARSNDRAGLADSVRSQEVEGQDPNGALYVIRHRLPDEPPREHRWPLPWLIPLEIWVFGILGGLAFASILAWYLVRPIQSLREGLGRLAGGELSVRVHDTMGRRRDEVADLAQSFDRMADRLQQLVAARDQLLHDVSHELRSPLARLHMAVGLARQSPTRIETSLDRIEAEGKRLDDMVGELLTLARAEAGAQGQQGYFSVYHLITSVLTDAAFEAQDANIRIDSYLRDLTDPDAEDGPILSGNATLIRRAIENVVRNALRFSPQGGTLTVSAAPDTVQGALVITIEDQGPGVAPEDLPTLFSPFVRGSNSRSDTGFGLGLAIARRAIEAHGGTISARNRLERGLAVRIALPMP